MSPGKYNRSAFRLISEAEMDRFCCTQRNRERSVVVQSLKKKFGLTSRQANNQYERHVKPRWRRHDKTVTETHSTVSDEAPAEMVSRPSDTPKMEPETVISAVAVKTEESVYDMDTDDDVDFEHWTGNDDEDDDDEGSLHLENIVEV